MSHSTTQYPYDAIVYITDTIGGLSYQASGVLISPDEVLTASHVVFSSGETAYNIVVTPAYSDGESPYGSVDGTTIHYNEINDAGGLISFQQSQNDYAVIHLASPLSNLGYMGVESNFGGGSVSVSGYPASQGGAQITDAEDVFRNPTYTLYDGTGLGPGSSGGPVWVDGTNGLPYVVGVVSSGSGTSGYFTQITTSAFNTIESWVQADDGLSAAGNPSSGGGSDGLIVMDTTTNSALAAVPAAYSGPVAGLQEEYINVSTDNLNIAASTPNWFIHSGSGEDAIAVSSGTNVLDGGTGSNFLTGGSGTDTFFVDDRGPAADIWSSVDNFHSSDAATIWGVSPSTFALTWVDNQGATGYTGLTAHFTQAGAPTASLTLVGYTSADLTDGRLSVTYGTDPSSGSNYMYVHAVS